MGFSDLYESGAKASQRGLFRNLVMIANADGVIDEAEQKLLDRMASKLDLSAGQVAAIMKNPENYPVNPPSSREERYERYIMLLEMVEVNGVEDEFEMKRLRKIGTMLGFTDESLDNCTPIIIEKVKAGIDRGTILEEIM